MDGVTDSVIESATDREDGCGGHVCLCTKSLCLSYGSRLALENVTVEIPAHAVTAVIGPSGSGKSSFLCCLNRMTDLNEATQVGGSVELGGDDIFQDLGKNPVALRRRVGMVFQRPNPFPFSIRKNLTLPLTHHGVTDKREIEERIESALRRVGLWERSPNDCATARCRCPGDSSNACALPAP